MEELKKKYNLFTGIAMVVGITIGSGIFVKAHSVLKNTNGSLGLSLLAWLIGGLIMVVSAYTFSFMASRVSKNNGAVDYFEASTNKTAGYYLGWYFATIYYPILVAIISFITSGFFITLCGFESTLLVRIIISFIFIVLSFLVNVFGPKIAGYLQTSSTIIKLIPIIVIAFIGIIIGVSNDTFNSAFEAFNKTQSNITVNNSFAKALIGTTFSYEGWIIATSINAEMKDSKKNLPKALIVGSIIVVLCYLLYNLGLALILENTSTIISNQEYSPILASKKLFGNAGPYLFNTFLLISCLGSLNGLTMASARGMYSLSVRGEGIAPDKVSRLHKKFNISILSAVIGFILSTIFLVIWYFSLKGNLPFLAMDELSVALVYFSYLFVYVYMMKKFKDLGFFKRFIVPGIAFISALFIIFASSGLFDLIFNNSKQMLFDFLYFVILIVVFMVIAIVVKIVNKKKVN